MIKKSFLHICNQFFTNLRIFVSDMKHNNPILFPSLHFSNTPSFHNSITPSFQNSTPPFLHYSITPSLHIHHSIFPTLHHSIFPLLHHSTSIIPSFQNSTPPFSQTPPLHRSFFKSSINEFPDPRFLLFFLTAKI